jgi:hypothetical protein
MGEILSSGNLKPFVIEGEEVYLWALSLRSVEREWRKRSIRNF